MRLLLVKYLNIAVLFAFEAWFLWPFQEKWEFQWEPLIGLLIAVITYLGVEAREHFAVSRPNPAPAPEDVELFRRLGELFPPSTIAFYRDHDFIHACNNDYAQKMFRYSDGWTTANFEFIDEELQAQHKKLKEKADVFANALAKYTTTNEHGHCTVAPTWHSGGPLPDWAEKEAILLNESATAFFDEHQTFFRLARRKLSHVAGPNN